MNTIKYRGVQYELKEIMAGSRDNYITLIAVQYHDSLMFILELEYLAGAIAYKTSIIPTSILRMAFESEAIETHRSLENKFVRHA